jgi:hypothetical protein
MTLVPSFRVEAALKVAPSSASGVPVRRGSVRRRWLRCLPQSLQRQYGGVGAVNRGTGESDGGFGGNGGVTIIQLDIEADSRAGAASSQFC